MDNSKRRNVRIIINVALIVAAVSGVISQMFFGVLVGRGLTSFLYYTTQSNIIVALIALFLIYFDLKNKSLPQLLKVFHHLSVVAITLTFIVFSLMLGPFLEMTPYFYSFQNLMLHNLVPILAIIAYLLFDYKLPQFVLPLAIISPLSYMLATYIFYFSGVSFGYSELPYFFLDYKKHGWLTINPPTFGILYSWILILLFVYIISNLLYFIKNKTFNNQKVIPIAALCLICLSTIFIVLNIII